MAFGEVGGEGGGASGAREPLLEPDALDEA